MTTRVPGAGCDCCVRPAGPARRTVLTAAGAVGAATLLAACGGGDTGDAVAVDGPADDPVITELATLREAGAVVFETADGSKAVAVAVGDDVAAYSTVCTHQGCTVEYDAQDAVLSCPCHGSRFDPADGGAVVAGPADAPLPTVEVVVDEDEGVLRRA